VSVTALLHRASEARSNLQLDPDAAQRAGTLDDSFGDHGIVILGVHLGSVAALAVQADGSIVAAGTSGNEQGGKSMTVARFDRAGRLDPTFGKTGCVRLDVGVNERADCVATSLAVQPDGSIVIAGCATTLPRGAFTGDDLALARLTSDGRLDETFGAGGWLQLSLGMSSKANAVVLEPDGHIVACGFVREPGSGRWRVCVLRVTGNGSLDGRFGLGGVTILPGASDDEAVSALREPDTGNIVVLAKQSAGFNKTFLVARFAPTGALDTSFGSGGTMPLSVGSGDCVPTCIVRQPTDGKYLVSGYLEPREFIVLRVLREGVLDQQFGSGGFVASSFPSPGGAPGSEAPLSSFGTSIAIQSDGSILLGGFCTLNLRSVGYVGNLQAVASDRCFAVARFDSRGEIDARAFGVGGVVTVDLGKGEDEIFAACLDGDRLIVAGASDRGMAMACLLCAAPKVAVAPGLMDASFGNNGLVIDDKLVNPCAMLLDEEGRTLVCGMEADGSGAPLRGVAVARFRPDGKRDASFGDGGIARAETERVCVPFALLMGPNGGCLGIARDIARKAVVLAQFAPEARSLRLTAVPGFPVPFDPFGIAIDASGRLIVAGGSGSSFAVARLRIADANEEPLATAVPDTTFGSAAAMPGLVLTDFGGKFASARAVSVLPDGKIVVGGSADVGEGEHPFDFAMVRYNVDGTLDTSFGRDGIKTLNLSGTDDSLHALLPRSDGTFVLVGESLDKQNETKVLVMSVGKDGALDRTFSAGAGFFESRFHATARAVALDDSGRILVVGSAISLAAAAPDGTESEADFLALRLEAGGTVDSRFAEQGLLRIRAGASGAQFIGIARRAGTGIVVAGKFPDQKSDKLILFRLGD
jgi:uncharacterized delta-60 repeat protein